VEEVTITDVSHLPEGNFNLFSLTRLQKKGWTLSGNTDYIKIKRGGTNCCSTLLSTHPRELCMKENSAEKGVMK
jgi:hypothetical protein